MKAGRAGMVLSVRELTGFLLPSGMRRSAKTIVKAKCGAGNPLNAQTRPDSKGGANPVWKDPEDAQMSVPRWAGDDGTLVLEVYEFGKNGRDTWLGGARYVCRLCARPSIALTTVCTGLHRQPPGRAEVHGSARPGVQGGGVAVRERRCERRRRIWAGARSPSCLQLSAVVCSGDFLTAGNSRAAQRDNPVDSRSRWIARSWSARGPPQGHANQCHRPQEARKNHPRPLDLRGLHGCVRGVDVLWPVPARGLRILPGARLVRALAGHPNAFA